MGRETYIREITQKYITFYIFFFHYFILFITFPYSFQNLPGKTSLCSYNPSYPH